MENRQKANKHTNITHTATEMTGRRLNTHTHRFICSGEKRKDSHFKLKCVKCSTWLNVLPLSYVFEKG